MSMNNPLFGFSPEAFEQFVRAIALSVFGPGVTAFGNGPDGGREAVFTGQVSYPYPPTETWAGYGVIQAKCKERTESADRDQKWALKVLQAELEAFVSSSSRTPKPQYYVFVVNVELSSVAGGGRDQANNVVRSYYNRLGLKGHTVWDANQLAAFLNTYEGVRRRFAAYLTPGDALAAMLEDIERRKPNVTRLLTAFLERELRADEASRLDQAGNRTEEQLRLADLFFDLPASSERQLSPPDEVPDEHGRLPHGVLAELLESGSRVLHPKSVYEQEIAPVLGKQESFPSRYVLLGGPGSGKSTVGQFLSQIHRSALLERREQHRLEPRVREIVRKTRELCDKEQLRWPTTPRYPFRVDLNRFAKALASTESDRIETLAGYLLNSLSRDLSIEYEIFLEWLAAYPWLLILDGLDEVPAGSNRPAMVDAVTNFIAEARNADADLFVIATSRHDGYAGEFADGLVAFRHVLPLSRPRALHYVEKYANARYAVTDANRAREIVTKLRESTKRELTAQLMESPLQVTFMATVVAARGDPGEDRWQLFYSYYRTIYDRERQKAVPPYDAILSKQQPIIDRLHHDVGFWLQYRGEMSGGTGVTLSLTQFEIVVNRYLAEVGHDGTDRARLAQLITEAARQRLVFLTSKIVGELSFEVRSLQEYMAAECIMSGEPDVVRLRLRAISPSPYWRNVFLIAASRCFLDAGSRHFQDAIRLLCEDLNSSHDQLLAATRAGSELALDVLQSGAVAENPNHARHLARIALPLIGQAQLSMGPEERATADERLASVYREVLKLAFTDEVQLRLGQTQISQTLGAWSLIARLVAKNVDWADRLASKFWPSDDASAWHILKLLPEHTLAVPWMARRLSSILVHIPVGEAKELVWRLRGPGEATSESGVNILEVASNVFGYSHRMHDFNIKISEFRNDRLELRVYPVFSPGPFVAEFAELAKVPTCHWSWLPFMLATELLVSPTEEKLADILIRCADAGWHHIEEAPYSRLPWLLATCLQATRTADELRLVAAHIKGGRLGTAAEWRSAEEKWLAEGISLQELRTAPPTRSMLSGERRTLAIPSCGWTRSVGWDASELRLLMHIAESAPAHVAHILLWVVWEEVGEDVELLELLRMASQSDMRITGLPPKVPDSNGVLAESLNLLDGLGYSDKVMVRYFRSRNSDVHEKWASAFQDAIAEARYVGGVQRDVKKLPYGLVRWMGRLAATGTPINRIPKEFLQLDTTADPRFRLAALLCQLTQPELSREKAETIADDICVLLDRRVEHEADHLVFATAESHLFRVPAIAHFLLRMHEKIPETVSLGVARCERLLRQLARKRASDLEQMSLKTDLKLPMLQSARS